MTKYERSLPRMVAKIDPDGEPVLFFPDAPARYWMLSYSPIGEHGEASMGYYRLCHNPKSVFERTKVIHLTRFYSKLYGNYRQVSRIRKGRNQFQLFLEGE